MWWIKFNCAWYTNVSIKFNRSKFNNSIIVFFFFGLWVCVIVIMCGVCRVTCVVCMGSCMRVSWNVPLPFLYKSWNAFKCPKIASRTAGRLHTTKILISFISMFSCSGYPSMSIDHVLAFGELKKYSTRSNHPGFERAVHNNSSSLTKTRTRR